MPVVYRRVILVAYIILITFLFCLPGSAFPKHSWLDDIWFDKWVHIGLFSVLCFIVCWVWKAKETSFFMKLFLLASFYGICIELVQDQYISNRSLDLGDWLADNIGSLLGIFIWRRLGYIKK